MLVSSNYICSSCCKGLKGLNGAPSIDVNNDVSTSARKSIKSDKTLDAVSLSDSDSMAESDDSHSIPDLDPNSDSDSDSDSDSTTRS